MIDITAEETETVESLKQRILVEFGTPGRTVHLTHRLKVLSDSKTLKEENIESGDVLDAAIIQRRSSASGRFPVADGAEFGFEEAPAYS
jgi:Ubiquitin family